MPEELNLHLQYLTLNVDVYEDDDWIDTVDVMKVLLQEKKKRLKLHFQNPYRKKCKHTGL